MSSNDKDKIMKKEPERQVVVAKYYDFYKVPKGKDINKAHQWWVKHGTLYVQWTKEDKAFEEITSDVFNDTCRPNEEEVGIAKDWGIESSDDEDDEE